MREQWVDYAKGIGIILVVIGHVNRGLDSAGISISEPFFKMFDSIIYTFHMPLFFFLSGLFFISSIQKNSKPDFIKKKIATIAYPYVIWSVIQGSIATLLSNFTNKKTDLISVLSFPYNPIGQFWFLYALFMIFIVACLIYNKRNFITQLPIITTVSFLLYIYSLNIGDLFHLNFITNNIVFFFAGCVFSTLKFDQIATKKNAMTLVISAFMFILVQYKFHFIDGMFYDRIGISTFVVAMVSIYFVYVLSLTLSAIKVDLLSKLGNDSMVIFLVHILCASGTRIILSKVFGINNWYLHMIAGTIAGLVIPIIFFELVKKLNLKFLLSYPVKSKSS
ncbi:acyltransferase 3 [Rahnella aceris]|uniref:Acyltransferase 3 n=1 Tax=Rahnella sp. (strain Y9602) TaxID=2703885 RepID=A0A0H3FDQ8_RAHSY|nr:acyltransferase [Rahnella aceris]ADW75176.1 acyltransferase 3 [Rahnella aceris]AZP52378.1 acyltransferase [Rahnella aquatilis]